MINQTKIEKFLNELTGLSRKYGIKINLSDCGPLLLEIKQKEDYQYECDIVNGNRGDIFFLYGINK